MLKSPELIRHCRSENVSSSSSVVGATDGFVNIIAIDLLRTLQIIPTIMRNNMETDQPFFIFQGIVGCNNW